MRYEDCLNLGFDEPIWRFDVEVTAIEYAISESDFWDIDDPEGVEALIRKTKKSLPQRLRLIIDCIDDAGALEDRIADAIREEFGWPACDFEYDIKRKELV